MRENIIVVTTWAEFQESLKQIHKYLDNMSAKGEKLRLAVDTETYIDWATKLRYIEEKRSTLSKKKQEELTDKQIATLIKWPVPKPWLNKWGEYDIRVRLIQIGLDPKFCDLQYVLDLDKIFQSYEAKGMANICNIFDFYELVGDFLGPLFNRASIIGQNLKYEYGIFWKHFKFRINTMRDTFLMSQVLNMGDKISHKLSFLYQYYIDESLFMQLTGKTFDEYHILKSEEQQSDWSKPDLDDIQIVYAADDVRPIWYVFYTLLDRLTEWAEKHGDGIYNIVALECNLIKAVAKAEIIGFPTDVKYYYETVKPYLEGKLNEAQAEVDKHTMRRRVEKIKKTTGRGKNKVITFEEKVTVEQHKLAYYADIREILGPELGSDKNLEKTGADELMFIQDKHWAVKWIVQYKKAQKLLGFFEKGDKSYFNNMDSNGVIHHTIHQIGTSENTIDSGRMSGSDPNLMQVPAQGILFKEIAAKKLVKPFFAAPEGKKLVIYDFSQIEPRLTGHVTEDEFLISCFIENKDMHAETAKYVFKLPYLPKKDTPEEHWRDKGKIMRLARTYMMGLYNFMKKVYIDTDGELDYILRGEEGKEEVIKILKDLDGLTPRVTEKQEEIGREVRELPSEYGSLAAFRNGNPFYVSKSLAGRTRRCCLLPEERTDAKDNPDSWHMGEKVLYSKTGKISTWANKFNSKLRDVIRQIFNNIIQSSAADIFKMSIVEINDTLEKLHDDGVIDEYEENFILPVHDEVICICKDNNTSLFKEIVYSKMKEVAERYITRVPVKVEGGSGRTWLQAK